MAKKKLVKKLYRSYINLNWAEEIPKALAYKGEGGAKGWCLKEGVDYNVYKRHKKKWQAYADPSQYVSHDGRTNEDKRLISGGTAEKAIERFDELYMMTAKPRNNHTLKKVLFDIHNARHPDRPIYQCSDNVVSRLKVAFHLRTVVSPLRTDKKTYVRDATIRNFHSAVFA